MEYAVRLLERIFKIKLPVQKALLDLGVQIDLSDLEFTQIKFLSKTLSPIKIAVEALCRRDSNPVIIIGLTNLVKSLPKFVIPLTKFVKCLTDLPLPKLLKSLTKLMKCLTTGNFYRVTGNFYRTQVLTEINKHDEESRPRTGPCSMIMRVVTKPNGLLN